MAKTLRFTGADDEIRILTGDDLGLTEADGQPTDHYFQWVSGPKNVERDLVIEDDAVADAILAVDRRIRVAPEVVPEEAAEVEGSTDTANAVIPDEENPEAVGNVQDDQPITPEVEASGRKKNR